VFRLQERRWVVGSTGRGLENNNEHLRHTTHHSPPHGFQLNQPNKPNELNKLTRLPVLAFRFTVHESRFTNHGFPLRGKKDLAVFFLSA